MIRAFVSGSLKMKFRSFQILPVLALCGLMACQQATQDMPASSKLPAKVVSPYQGVDVRKESFGGDFTLTDGTGKPFKLSSLQGKVVLLAFGFAHCPDVCPAELLTYKDTVQQLAEQGKNVAVVFVSVDPERDTPDLIGKYVRQFHPDFIGLTDTSMQPESQLSIIKKQYRIISEKTEVQSDKIYNIDHTSGAYILDKKGKVAVFEPYGADAKQIAHDLRLVLAEN